ncbi:unnamed protein product [Paramecium sonneborni]|uniref:Protein kinase domain-containing protein n=1 Tax=Paramecium sonneborni TaxID=65129 RepID=A0A8S1RM51_9CILI|nr:unnamed protein product [Paramecium sonneborni]
MGEKRIEKYLFNINHKIGEASYATVFKGINEKTGENVAIKMKLFSFYLENCLL